MNVLDIVRSRVQLLYEKHPDIHVNVTIKRPHRVIMNNLPVVITGVYSHMFQVEYIDKGISRQFLHQYTDIVTRDVEILEMPDIVPQNTDK